MEIERGRSKIDTRALQSSGNVLDREQPERDCSEANLFFGMPRTRRNRRTSRPSLENLEYRSLLSGYSPTDIEQLYLEELNDARFNPAAYGVSLGLDLSSIAPSQPLAMNTLLVESARLHSQDMIAQNYFSHDTPQGVGPEQRIQATGFNATGYAESIEYNTNSAPVGTGFPSDYAAADTGVSLSNLIVDQGVPDLGHRVMLLDIGGQFHADRQVGIGIASQDSTSDGFLYRQTDTTIDMASTSNSNPFLTGVVFNDMSGNGEYEPGEGLSGVTITVSNVGTTTTLDAGGYSIQVPAGIYTVTASGGGLAAAIARTVVVQNDNVALNFDADPNGATLSAASDGSVNGQLGSFIPFQASDTASSYSARIDWGDGNASFATLTPNADGSFSVNGSNTYASAGVYAVRVLVTHLSDGQTFALNATVAVDSGSNSGSSNPGPVNPGHTGPSPENNGQGSSGTSVGPISEPKKKEKKHPKPKAKTKHPAHPDHGHKSKPRPIQGARKTHAPHKKPG
jgi:uncharacterized protein YkwD